MEKVIIRQLAVEPLEVFTYLVTCPQTEEAVIIDPAGEEDRILSFFILEG